jgi:hypothetical protein
MVIELLDQLGPQRSINHQFWKKHFDILVKVESSLSGRYTEVHPILFWIPPIIIYNKQSAETSKKILRKLYTKFI